MFTMNILRRALLVLVLVSGYSLYAQPITIFEENVCTTDTHSSYTNTTIRAAGSNTICGSGTRISGVLSGDTDIISSYSFSKTPDGPHSVTVLIDWAANATGTVSIDVYYEQNKYKFPTCRWKNKTYMYTYLIHRESYSPGGTLDGLTTIKSTGSTESTLFTLFYKPSDDYPVSLHAQAIRYWNGEETDTIPILNGEASYPITLITYRAQGFGTFNVQTEVEDGCGTWYPGPSTTLTVVPSCKFDAQDQVTRSVSGLGSTYYPDVDGYEVTKGNVYSVDVSGVTDFANHYYWNAKDGGQDISFSGTNFSISKAFGSYRIEAVPKSGREDCPVIKPVLVFVGGRDTAIQQPCSVTLPDDLAGMGYPYETTDVFLSHFAAHVITKRFVIVEPGVTLGLGAELTIEVPDPVADPNDPDKTLNYIEATGYDEYGRVASSTRSYFDARGKALQTQYKDLETDIVLANATLYDAYGRPVITTLSAPVQAGTAHMEPDECGEEPDHEAGAAAAFTYKADFVTGPNGAPYTYANFDGSPEDNSGNKENAPDPVNASVEGTLGWYYSTNNGKSTNEKMNEPLVATTGYPYSRTLFYRDGTGDVKAVTRPGDVFHAGTGLQPTTKKEDVGADDPYLADYFGMRQRDLKLTFNAASVHGEFFKTTTLDEDGNRAVVYSEKSGKSIIALYFGKQTSPITKSYQFYDYAGRLITSISPNGLAAYRVTGSTSNFAAIDKSSYSYNAKGLLVEMTEADAGTTKYIYRRDGKIRFSQNAKQFKEPSSTYSYTQYDRSGRPIESGEYVSGNGGIAFGSAAMSDILEDTSLDGGLSDAHGAKRYRTQTVYDVPDENHNSDVNSNLPADRTQRFVQGTVSKTKRDDQITSWYSYDERGRLEWMVQNIKALGVKTIDYRYGPTGAVQEVIYQRGKDDQFSHYYTYDKDGRMLNAYTSIKALEYNVSGEITNPEALMLQATYYYYLHGPLKRVELAGDLQGIDYVYTADGSLKSINHADPARDPGQDGTQNTKNSVFRPDVFGMTIDYYNNDYAGAAYNAGNATISSEYDQQFSGNIRALRWHSPVEPNEQHGYAFKYDERNQLLAADWAGVAGDLFTINALSSYHEGVSRYDGNGNIDALNRKDNLGVNTADFKYHYHENSNQLAQITQGDNVVRSYEYDQIGQMVGEKGEAEKYVDYDVTGKVTTVYSDPAGQKPMVSFAYDDRGFRLNKTSHNDDGNAVHRTWYVRDASGNVAGTYEEDIEKATEPKLSEVPVYASGRIGLYKPDYGLTLYEINDHLGNVRAVIGDKLEVEYLATMESERAAKELQAGGGDFENVKSAPTASYINHTPNQVVVNGKAETIDDPNEVNRLNNWPMGVHTPDPIGVGTMIWVHPGDVIKAEVYAKYANFDDKNNNVVAGLSTFLSSAFGVAPKGVDIPGIFSVVDNSEFALQSAWAKLDDEQPQAFLTYLLFDNNFKLQKDGFDFAQVSDYAKIVGSAQKPHERLSLDVTIQKEGFIYVYVSNLSDQNMDVYFDDLKVTHTYSDIVAGGDYYPFGLTIKDRQIEREFYRYGYQGQNAEKDEETGWNHFELREYDPVIGRWTIVDPRRQYWTPYNSMGNNPIRLVDPSGGSTFDDYRLNSDGSLVLIRETDDAFHAFYDENDNLLFTTSVYENGRRGVYSKSAKDILELNDQMKQVQAALQRYKNAGLYEGMVLRLMEKNGDVDALFKLRDSYGTTKASEITGYVIDKVKGKYYEKKLNYQEPDVYGINGWIGEIEAGYHFFTDKSINIKQSIWNFAKDTSSSLQTKWNDTVYKFHSGVYSINHYGAR